MLTSVVLCCLCTAADVLLLLYCCRMALGTMSEEERLSSDSDFKPNLVNSVCYLVEQVREHHKHFSWNLLAAYNWIGALLWIGNVWWDTSSLLLCHNQLGMQAARMEGTRLGVVWLPKGHKTICRR
jgi:hypothetical protein